MLALIVSILLAGCAGGNVGLRAGDSSLVRSAAPPPGNSYSYAAVQAEAAPNAYFGVLFLGSFLLGMQDEYRLRDGRAYARKPPELDAGRSIAERDCTQPLGPLEGNLRCK
jgi:hypothetical protein